MSQRSQRFVAVGEKYTQSKYTDIKAMYHRDGGKNKLISKLGLGPVRGVFNLIAPALMKHFFCLHVASTTIFFKLICDRLFG